MRASLMMLVAFAAALILPEARALGRDQARLEGQDYNKARAQILKFGWTPVKGECIGPGVSSQICARYPELDICRFTGNGACTMTFSRPRRCLVITTTESPPGTGGSTVVRDVTFLGQPCAMTGL